MGGKIFCTCPDRSWVHPASCTMGTRSYPEVKSGRGVTLTLHPLLVPWSRKSRAIPLLPLWALRPVQSRSGCTVRGRSLPFFFTVMEQVGSFLYSGGGQFKPRQRYGVSWLSFAWFFRTFPRNSQRYLKLGRDRFLYPSVRYIFHH